MVRTFYQYFQDLGIGETLYFEFMDTVFLCYRISEESSSEVMAEALQRTIWFKIGAVPFTISSSKVAYNIIYEVDPLICPKCQGLMQIISLIEDQGVIDKILSHLGLNQNNQRPPPKPKSLEIQIPSASSFHHISFYW
jgi:hypothetical protein